MAVIRAHQDQLIATQTQHTAILRQIQQHLGILSPPEHDMPGPSEPTNPSQEALPVEQIVPHKETTTVEIKTLIQSTQTTIAEPLSPHDPPTTTWTSIYFFVFTYYKKLHDTFRALPRVHFIHTIYHFEAREVRSPTLQTICKLKLK
ncbi:hypothetical protein AAG906_015551 [Vitis piasezkii]